MQRIVLALAFIGMAGLVVALLPTNSSANETINFTYDAKGRVILVTHSGSVNNNVITNYTLDHADNRKNQKITGAP